MKPLRLTSRISLRAASGKPRRFVITAYNGDLIHIEGLPYVIDLAGLQATAGLPILLDHEASTETTLGTVQKVQNSGKQLVLSGLVTGHSERVRNVVAAADDGQQWQASVGIRIDNSWEVPVGEVVTINGRQHRGPFTHVRSCLLFETSVLPAGADASTQVNLAARRAALKGSAAVPDFETWVRDEFAVEVSSLTPELIAVLQSRYDMLVNPASAPAPVPAGDAVSASAVGRIRSASAGEHRRIASINRLAGGHPLIAAAAIEKGWSPAETELAVLKASNRMSTPSNLRTSHDAGDQDTLEAALLCRAGRDELSAKIFGDRTTSAARALRCNSFVDLAARALQLEGRDAPQNRSQMIKAAFSTVSLPTALSNVTGKVLMEAYKSQKATWRSFAKVSSAADFKAQVGIRPSAFPNLDPLAPGGSITHGTISEATFPWRISTFAKQFKVTREDVINDDISFLDQLPTLMAQSAIRTLSDLVWQTILANGGNFFHADHGNLLSAAGGALSITSLSTLVSGMRAQRDAAGNDLDLMPATLVVPPELETTARTIINSALTGRDDGGPTGNALQNIVNLEVESRISNTVKFGNDANATQFFLFANPQDAPIIVGFLDGAETPVVESFGMDSDINHLGLGFRCYHDFGVAFGDWRAAARSDGTPPAET